MIGLDTNVLARYYVEDDADTESQRQRLAARRLIGLGVVSAVPTIVLGLGDLPALTPRKRRVAVLHAAANSSAVLCYLVSWWQRRDDRHEVVEVLAIEVKPTTFLANGVAADHVGDDGPASHAEGERQLGPVAVEDPEGVPVEHRLWVEVGLGQQLVDRPGDAALGVRLPAGDLASVCAIPAQPFFAFSTTASMRSPRKCLVS